jgi:hypothetical protein
VADVWPVDEAVKLGYLLTLTGTAPLEDFARQLEAIRSGWRDLLPKDLKGNPRMDWKNQKDTPAIVEEHSVWQTFFHTRVQKGRATVTEINAHVDALNVNRRKRELPDVPYIAIRWDLFSEVSDLRNQLSALQEAVSELQMRADAPTHGHAFPPAGTSDTSPEAPSHDD